MSTRLLVLLTVSVVLLSACGPAVPPDATGEEIYLQVCARCHGENLEGRVGPPLGPGSPVAQRPDAYLYQTIERGKGRMPAFRRTLTEEQIRAVVAYLRQVQSADAEDSGTSP